MREKMADKRKEKDALHSSLALSVKTKKKRKMMEGNP